MTKRIKWGDFLNCNCVFCRFQHFGKCQNTLEEIQIDERGFCSQFVAIKINKDTCQKIPESILDKLKVYPLDIDKKIPPSK